MRRPLFFLVALGIATGTASAQRIEQGTMKRLPASDGKAMFENYCVACHGMSGVGDGPAAKALTKTPADLTRISTRNGGSFPDVRVRRYIEGADEVPAHGSRDMPIWGSLFRSMDRDNAALRVAALSEYLKSLQK